jgi:formylglycine-generating enzyme required for sulfatase activity
LYDLSGNVFEWNWDWNADYPAGTLTDTRGPASGNGRVGRGGSWFDPGFYCTVAFRNNYDPNYRDGDFGVRVVRN